MKRAMPAVVVGVLGLVLVGGGAAAARRSHGNARATAIRLVRTAAPIQGKERVGKHQFYSTNWSGYAAYNDTFSNVQGTWSQPAADCSVDGNKETDATFFAGLDGFNSRTVEQTGVDAICVHATAYYVPWVEFYPAPTTVYSDTVEPGDLLTSEVSQDGTNVTATLTDTTQGWSESRSIPVDSLAFSSAEWIAEKTTHQMTDFGSVTWSSASATDTGAHTGAIDDSAWSNTSIIMVNHGGPHYSACASPGGLMSSGTSFMDTWSPC